LGHAAFCDKAERLRDAAWTDKAGVPSEFVTEGVLVGHAYLAGTAGVAAETEPGILISIQGSEDNPFIRPARGDRFHTFNTGVLLMAVGAVPLGIDGGSAGSVYTVRGITVG